LIEKETDVSARRAPDAEMPTMVNAFDDANLHTLPPRTQTQMQQRADLLGPGYRVFYEEPVEIVRGAGALLFDADGTEYLDAYNNVASVGHCNEHVIEAVSRQLAVLNTNTRYIQQSILDYSAQLLSTMPDELGHVMFTCTGSEANDLAARVANYHTGAEGVIVTANAYHGLTAAVSAFSPSLGKAVPLAPHVRTIPPPDAMRIGSDVGEHMRSQVRAAVADLERHGHRLSTFIADSIFSSDGVFADPAGFLAPVLDEVHKAGGLYVADEVQPGFGRCGDTWWGFQRHGLVPDIVTMGKPMGNGTPVAAAVFRPELLVDFGRNVRYFNTFGGNSVSIAAAQAVLDVIGAEGLIQHAGDVGRYLVTELEALTRDYEQVAEIRGAGLFIGIDIVTDRESNTPDGAAGLRIVNEMRRRHVLISASGPTGHALKIRPPLVFSRDDADRLLSSLAASLTAKIR
jgi:4-aminobutyrate aminotransferase-like enzyme